MRFAAIADIHGNASALEAVLADIAAQGIVDIVNLGDSLSGPLEAGRTADILSPLGLPTVDSDNFTGGLLATQHLLELGRTPQPRPLTVYGTEVASRLLLGTALYPSPQIMSDAIRAARAGIVTVSLRREQARGRTGERFLDLIRALPVRLLPNTAGCRTARDAITTAEMARELFGTDWVKLEVIANDDTLQPDVFGLVEAARVLVAEDFKVFPYTTEDLSVAERLQQAGCEVIMPWAAPIGSGRPSMWRSSGFPSSSSMAMNCCPSCSSIS